MDLTKSKHVVPGAAVEACGTPGLPPPPHDTESAVTPHAGGESEPPIPDVEADVDPVEAKFALAESEVKVGRSGTLHRGKIVEHMAQKFWRWVSGHGADIPFDDEADLKAKLP